MKNFKKYFLGTLMILFSCRYVWSMDFGILLDQNAGFGGYGTEPKMNYSGILIPRFSALLGENGDFYASAGLRADYETTWTFTPELLRTEFSWRFPGSSLTAGRMYYSDPLGFAAEGLFDGIQYSFYTDAGNFSAGAWYTGFLYKKRANITMNDDELEKISLDLDYNDFLNTYFAPRRALAAINWEHPGLGGLVQVNLALLGQFDLDDLPNFSDALHTQYLSGKVIIPFGSFILDFGACAELAEDSGEFSFALAGELGAAFGLPTPFEDQFSVLLRYSSGKLEDSQFAAFLPLTARYQGELLKPNFSGISMISLNYLARLNSTMSLEGFSNYFIRNDLATLKLYGTDGYFLGNEFFARFLWSPFSDIQINCGAGIFLPVLGNAAPSADVLWRAELNVILSLY